MQFSVFIVGQLPDPTPENERRMLHDSVELAVRAEEMGFDRVWAVEHHGLKWYSHMSTSEIFLTWVAARTSRIRVGHGVVTLPFGYQHPVRVAERTAMLDVLSDGRLDVGVGRSASRREMSLFGVDASTSHDQVEEALQIVTGVWGGDTSGWRGSLDIAPGEVFPRPRQDPHPPLFTACTNEAALRSAAHRGLGALVLGLGDLDLLRRRRTVYDEARAARTGRDLLTPAVNDHFAVVCPTVVLDDAAEARRIGVRGQQFFVESSRHWYGGAPPPDLDVSADGERGLRNLERAVLREMEAAGVPARPEYVAAYHTHHPYGTADLALSRVRELADAGADEVMCLVQMGGVPHAACMETVRQWGEHVIPHFR
ncbi:LLM class flavin-dependent oxidoreductase [Streptomyces phytohabitans]|uniref:LLM class flavin-dependent oxidoreductase n=1 Tax=Streptomyces phytohabitans TaxID=1150371 RepID=UPI00345BB9DB